MKAATFPDVLHPITSLTSLAYLSTASSPINGPLYKSGNKAFSNPLYGAIPLSFQLDKPIYFNKFYK